MQLGIKSNADLSVGALLGGLLQCFFQIYLSCDLFSLIFLGSPVSVPAGPIQTCNVQLKGLISLGDSGLQS